MPTSLPSLFLVLLALPGPVIAPVPGSEDGTGWKLERLDVEVILLPEEGRAEMVGRLKLVLEAPTSLGPTLRLNAESAVMSFVAVEAEGASVELGQDENSPAARLAHVRFEDRRKAGAEVELFFEAFGEGSGEQLLFDERIAIASWTDAWHPVPVPKPGESPSGKMRTVGTTTLHMPADWTGVCNGTRVERVEEGESAREVWELADPLARSFAAGPFHVDTQHAGERTVTVCRTSPVSKGPDLHALAAAASLEAMEAKLGPYPYQDFYIVEVPADLVSWSGASQQGIIFAASEVFGYEDGNLALFAHEMGHGWWGNLVGTAGPGSLVCGETLAQYGVVIALEEIEGDAAAVDFLRFSRRGYSPYQCARGFFGMWNDGNARPLAELDNSWRYDHTLSDAKGHWVYTMLRRRIGEELFHATLRGLIETYANREMSLDDVRAAFLAAAPEEARLEVFFEQWLERTGAPVLTVEWQAGEAGLEVVVRQEQPEEPYHLWVELAVEVEGRSEALRHRIEVEERETRTILAGVEGTTAVHLDPDHRILRWTPEYGERPQ